MGRHITQGHLTSGDLIGTEHDHHTRTDLVSKLELAFEAAPLVIHLGRHPRIATPLHQTKRSCSGIGINAGNKQRRSRDARKRMPQPLKSQLATLIAKGKTKAGCIATADLGSKLVVTATAADSVLGATRVCLHLEHGAGVVVKTTNERAVLDIGNTCGVKEGLDRSVVLPTIVAQIVGDARGLLHDVGAPLVFTIKGTKRIDVHAGQTRLAQLAFMFGHVGTDRLAILRTAMLAPHGVEQQRDSVIRDADFAIEAHQHDDGLGVDGRLFCAKALHTNLIELAIATRLGTLSTKHRTCIHQFRRGGTLGNKVVFHDGTNHTRGSLRTQRETAFALDMATAEQRAEVLAGQGGEHLLGNHVGCLADAADEQVGLLDDRRHNRLVSITTEHIFCSRLKLVPKQSLVGQKVVGPRRLIDGHVGPLLITAHAVVGLGNSIFHPPIVALNVQGCAGHAPRRCRDGGAVAPKEHCAPQGRRLLPPPRGSPVVWRP